MKKSIATICIHGKNKRKRVDNTGAVSFPIFQSATFVHPEFEKSTGYDYSRLQNPTREELERIVADLENGIDALAFSTGMAAIHALIDTLTPNAHIIATDDLYGGSTRILLNIAKKNGIDISFVATDNIENIKKAL